MDHLLNFPDERRLHYNLQFGCGRFFKVQILKRRHINGEIRVALDALQFAQTGLVCDVCTFL
jgi:hypothetical protein